MPDVTEQVRFGDNDGEGLPLTQCVCGQTFPAWDVILHIYPDEAHTMSCCGRRLYFKNRITVFEVPPVRPDASVGK